MSPLKPQQPHAATLQVLGAEPEPAQGLHDLVVEVPGRDHAEPRLAPRAGDLVEPVEPRVLQRGGQPHVDVDFRGPVAIVIGGEGGGLDPDVIARADTRVTIPMAGRVESLNAAVATAILLYEARRQRSTNS